MADGCSSLRGCATQAAGLTGHHTARLGRPAQFRRRRLRPAAATVIEQHALDGSLPSTSGSARLGASSSSIPCEDGTRLALERVYRLNGDLARQLWEEEPSISSDSRLWDPGCFLVTVDDKPARAKSEAKSGSNKPQPGNGRPGPGEKSPDYYANVGDAIRTLREDIPLLFERDLNYNIYREDIVFRDPRNTFAGLRNYKTIFWSLRFHGRIFFRSLYVDVQRIWQPDDSVIRMRWSVHGKPRLPWEAEGVFDGISQYRLDSQGMIYEHSVDNVILRDPPMQGIPLLTGLNLVQIPQGMQQPCPGAWIAGRAATASAEQHVAGDTTRRPVLAAVAASDSGAGAAAKRGAGSVVAAPYEAEASGSRWWHLDQGQDVGGLPAPAES